MKTLLRRPVFWAMGAGALGFALHLWATKLCTDKNGLWLQGHPLVLCLFCLAAIVVIATVLFAFKEKKDSLCLLMRDRFLGAFGSFAAAFGFLFLALDLPWDGTFLGNAAKLLACLTASSMSANGAMQALGKKSAFAFSLPAVLLFMVYPLSRHGVWSYQTQFLDYGFSLLALVSLLLFSYAYCHLTVTSLSARWMRFSGLCACFFNLVAAAGELPAFFLPMAVWASSTLVGLQFYKAPSPMEIPDHVAVCLERLEKEKTPGYLVGGCVRDHILGNSPHDYDLCTAATPEKLKEIFSDYPLVLSGEKHGTIGVVFQKEVLEITTFRTEGTYEDGRHPDWVEFVPDLEADLSRRDFTVNAIAYNPKEGYIDPFGGIGDLKAGILQAVGNPELRFTEDALRILRGVRFAVRFGLSVDKDTLQAMFSLKENMDNLAEERIFSELCKLLPLVDAEDLLLFQPILSYVLPELAPCVNFCQHSPHHAYDVYTHTAYVVENAPKDLALRWAALLHDTGKPVVFTQDENGRGHFYGHAKESAKLADAALRRLKAPTALREEVVSLVAGHMDLWDANEKVLRRQLSKRGIDACKKQLTLQRADYLSKGVPGDNAHLDFDAVEGLIDKIQAENACPRLSDLAVKGNDLMELGFAPGPRLGQVLETLLALVLEGDLPNEKEALLEKAKELL